MLALALVPTAVVMPRRPTLELFMSLPIAKLWFLLIAM